MDKVPARKFATTEVEAVVEGEYEMPDQKVATGV